MRKKNKKNPKRVDADLMRRRASGLARRMSLSEIKMLRRLARSGDIPFDFQVVFGYYIADFVFPTRMLILELDGKSHKKTKQWDEKRDRFLSTLGFAVWRITNTEVGTFDLNTVRSVAETPGYEQAVRMGQEAYRANQTERCSLDDQNKEVSERIFRARKKQPHTDMTPRLIKNSRVLALAECD